MSLLLESLPGVPMPVSKIVPASTRYWQEAAQSESDARASQMNLVLVFGDGVTPADAAAQLGHALALASRYPCRIIALCPDAAPDAKPEGRFYIPEADAGNGRGETLMLGFPVGVSPKWVESQVSVWLESDLPVYVWLHRMTAERAAVFAPMLRGARRVVFDSSISTGDFSAAAQAKSGPPRDLAVARLLAVRQALGQFLSAYPPESLVKGLERIVIRHAPGLSGEARSFAGWLRAGLDECSRRTGIACATTLTFESVEGPICLSTEWSYAGGDFLKWEHSSKGSGAQITASIAGRKYAHPLRIPFLDQPGALAEAMFF